MTPERKGKALLIGLGRRQNLDGLLLTQASPLPLLYGFFCPSQFFLPSFLILLQPLPLLGFTHEAMSPKGTCAVGPLSLLTGNLKSP